MWETWMTDVMIEKDCGRWSVGVLWMPLIVLYLPCFGLDVPPPNLLRIASVKTLMLSILFRSPFLDLESNEHHSPMRPMAACECIG